MTGKTWLWIALGALLLVSVCCIGLTIGGIVGSQNQAATPAAASTVSQPLASERITAPAEGSVDPTLPPPAPTMATTQPPTAPAQAPTTAPTQPPLPPPTLTAVPSPPPPAAPPAAPPASSDLQALVEYANAMQPLLEAGGELVKRDGEILEASEEGNDSVLCDGRLAADRGAMSEIVRSGRCYSAAGQCCRHP